MMPNCPRCREMHADDPRSCRDVRAVEYYETGAIRRIEYHAVDGIQAPVTEQRVTGFYQCDGMLRFTGDR
jgi:hypothetical protein